MKLAEALTALYPRAVRDRYGDEIKHLCTALPPRCGTRSTLRGTR
jgi:hypothetical protein